MKIVSTLLALLALPSCSANFTGGDHADSWTRPLPQTMAEHILQFEGTLHEVTPQAREEAVTRLVSEPLLPISLEEARNLTGEPLTEGRFYLIRGICLGCGNGTFKAYCDGNNLWIYNFSLASKGAHTTRWPVVAALAHPPEQVYVDCGSAQ